MYNETLYNVFVQPEVENKLFKKRNAFNNWLIATIIYIIILTTTAVVDLLNNDIDLSKMNQFLNFTMIVLVVVMVYVLTYNPLKKYHNTLQIYYYLIFLSYFNYKNKKYPIGFFQKIKYFVIVQSCIDSIDKYINRLEDFLISGDNLVRKIKLLRSLRNLLYKSKDIDFFNQYMDEFNSILDLYFDSVHSGLKGVIDFNENVDYLDKNDLLGIEERCNKIIAERKVDKKSENGNSRKANPKVIITLLITAGLVTPLASYYFGIEQWGSYILNGAVFLSSVVTVVGFLLPKNVG